MGNDGQAKKGYSSYEIVGYETVDKRVRYSQLLQFLKRGR